jgi:hypothetical protein
VLPLDHCNERLPFPFIRQALRDRVTTNRSRSIIKGGLIVIRKDDGRTFFSECMRGGAANRSGTTRDQTDFSRSSVHSGFTFFADPHQRRWS